MGICYTEGCRRAENGNMLHRGCRRAEDGNMLHRGVYTSRGWEYVTQRGVDEQRMGICYTEGCRRAEDGNMLHRGV